MPFFSKFDHSLIWPDADAVEAWKATHPDDIRGHVVIAAPPTESADNGND